MNNFDETEVNRGKKAAIVIVILSCIYMTYMAVLVIDGFLSSEFFSIREIPIFVAICGALSLVLYLFYKGNKKAALNKGKRNTMIVVLVFSLLYIQGLIDDIFFSERGHLY
ncbi:MAG: hypothetical protein JJT76_00645 [Clostridiaceae bacterium]|nr:hypothetical protein [Clostridiaceae bacterium]